MLLAKLKAKHDEKMLSRLPPEEVAKLLASGALLVDVRSKAEALLGIAPGATNIPLLALKRRLAELPRGRDIILYCGTGARAGKAKEVLDAHGYQAFNGGSYKEVRKIVGTLGKTAPSRG